MPDLTKLAFHSGYPAFKNNNEKSGTFTISGTVVLGTNTQTFTVDLGFEPDLVDIMFNGPTFTAGDTRPDDAWFRQGSIGVPYTGSGDSRWYLFGKVSGSTLTITAIEVQQASGTETLTATDFTYKVVDYSVF